MRWAYKYKIEISTRLRSEACLGCRWRWGKAAQCRDIRGSPRSRVAQGEGGGACAQSARRIHQAPVVTPAEARSRRRPPAAAS